MEIEIPGRMPGINDIVKDAKRGRGKYQPYAIAKKEWTETVAWCAKKLPALTVLQAITAIFTFLLNKNRML